MTQLLRDLIDIPERVHQSDFVLRLSEGVAHPAETLHDYVVTEQLVRAFGQSLDLVRRAVVGRRSMGAYLHGSFGSGKSHFMAVLHLLLEHNAEARSIPQLAPVVAELKWAEGKRFLLVPYHLVGARAKMARPSSGIAVAITELVDRCQRGVESISATWIQHRVRPIQFRVTNFYALCPRA